MSGSGFSGDTMNEYRLDTTKLAVVGLGYVGLPLAVEFGKSRPVAGFDVNAARINALRSGHDSTLEVKDAELANAKNLSFTNKLADIADCNVYIVRREPT